MPIASLRNIPASFGCQTLFVTVADAVESTEKWAKLKAKPSNLQMASVVICPASLVSHWVFECEKYFASRLVYSTHSGSRVLVVVNPVRYHALTKEKRRKLRCSLGHQVLELERQRANKLGCTHIAILHVVVTSYAIAAADCQDLVHIPCMLKVKSDKTISPAASAQGTFHYCIVDEAHKISNPASRSTKACKTVGMHSRHRIALTGMLCKSR